MSVFGKTVDRIRDELNSAMPIFRDMQFGSFLLALLTSHNAAAKTANAAVLTKAGLVIKAGSSAVVKAANAVLANIDGVWVYKAANTDMAALAGNIATTKHAVWAFYVDAAGTLTSAKTADADTLAAAIALIPTVPAGLAMIGAVAVSNATGGNFVGGTTALDAASITAVYMDTNSPVPNSGSDQVRDFATF